MNPMHIKHISNGWKVPRTISFKKKKKRVHDHSEQIQVMNYTNKILSALIKQIYSVKLKQIIKHVQDKESHNYRGWVQAYDMN